MEIYFAPLEGITGYLYRSAHHDAFTGVDKYFTPFLSPNQNRALGPKEIRDVLPENNQGMHLVPQILTNRAALFLQAAKELEEKYGYQEVNLNLGCPSRTVAAKGKGAGFLADPESLYVFFEQVFEKLKIKMSVKTRIGVDKPEEFFHLIEIFNQYPLHELIIHPRVQKDYYDNIPNWDIFAMAMQESRNPLCYNGDIFTVRDFKRFQKKFPDAKRIMLGRGLLMNPMLAEELKTGGNVCGLDKKRLKAFHDRLYADYKKVMSGEKNVLFKMKEFWVYAGCSFPGEEKLLKRIKKASGLADYDETVYRLFRGE